jgi:malate synthase
MAVANRLSYTPVEGADALFSSDFIEYLLKLHDLFGQKVLSLREKRAVVLELALKRGIMPSHHSRSTINTGDWQVPPVPEELKLPGIEISGPASVTSMFINALNPGPDGERAEGDLDDDEDSGGHRFIDTVTVAHNRLRAVERTLTFRNPLTEREYKVQPGNLPFFMHRERGLHLDEPEVTVDGVPIAACILGTALTLYYAGRAQIKRKQGVYFYLPKLESAAEAAFWREFFDFSWEHLQYPDDAVIRAVHLIESLPAVYQMEELLYEMGPYAAGLNAARWDLKASIFEFVMMDPNSVWPDRFGVDIKSTEFLANIFRRLVAVCLKRGAVPLGGMATALPSKDDEVNKVAAAAIRDDKEWEAKQGFLRAWVAHIFHMKTAADPFKKLIASGWKPTPEMHDPDNFPVEIKVPSGPITVGGTRQNARMLVEYVEGWLNGRGAKGIDSLAGKPGIHPALMEDLATGRMSAAQVAQRIIHGAKDTNTGQVHDFSLVKGLIEEEVEDILTQLISTVDQGDDGERRFYADAEKRYRKSVKIAMRWIKNYTELDFRSLGSYTRKNLEDIALADDAF